MANYLINRGLGGEHYFFKPYEGICMKRLGPSGTFSEHTQIVALGREPFSVLDASDGSIHLVCVDSENMLVYASCRNNVWKRYILAKIPKDVSVSDMHLYSVRGRLNLLYSAAFGGEHLLIHCILGNHAKPSTVSALLDSHFFVYKNKVYYTKPDGALGFTNLEDEKPENFNRLYDNATSVSVWEDSGKEFLIFIRNSRLFINGKEILYDSAIENPVFVKGADRLYIMWKSGGFIRYISSFNGGATWSEPMRFISTGISPKLYTFRSGNALRLYYGYENGNHLTTLGVSNVFASCENSELKDMKNKLLEKTQEAEDAKKEVERLNKILSGLIP
ncbi:MAG: hypothetical protein IJ300_03005 [Clostridia bacterium]|nr:hypothetical protein [Clostridia bacterium]